MNTTTFNDSQDLEEVLYSFSLALDGNSRPGDLLDEYIKLHPQFAEELTEFAVELALVGMRQSPPKEGETSKAKDVKRSPAVSLGMSRFQNRLHANRQEVKRSGTVAAPKAASVVNPIESLDTKAFRELSRKLQANNVFVGKLRDRLITPTTISDGFMTKLAADLGSSKEIVSSHLFAPQQVTFSQQYFKSDSKPQVCKQQTFEEAVKGAGLTPEQEAYLLGL